MKKPNIVVVRKLLPPAWQRLAAAGNIRFVADGEDSNKVNGHADRFWALALALHAGSNPSAPIEFMSGGPRESSQPLGDFIYG